MQNKHISHTILRFNRYIVTDEPSTETSPTTNAVTPTSTNATIAFTSTSSVSPTTPTTPTISTSQRSTTRNRGVIFPSVKNKPSPANSTFTTDTVVNVKDVKVRKYNKLVWPSYEWKNNKMPSDNQNKSYFFLWRMILFRWLSMKQVSLFILQDIINLVAASYEN